MSTNPYNEAADAQAPAQDVLETLGYQVLSRQEAKDLRRGNLNRVVLRDVLIDQLGKLNSINYRGESIPFSQANLEAAVTAIERVADKGVVHTNEDVYDLLVLGKSFEQQVDGARKSFTIRYVDWDRPERNVYHVTREFDVRGPDGTVRPMDVVAFVNGIPFIAIECKRRDDPHGLQKAVHDMVDRYEEMPRLFWYVQLAIATNVNGFKYGTAGTSAPFFSVWREDDELYPNFEEEVEAAIGRTPTTQDVNLYALCRPQRLLDLVRHFVLFDAGDKKIARHQQYFAVKRTVTRVRQAQRDESDRDLSDCSGIIWHTQGSGKSITMVFLFEALSRVTPGARVVLVTDRVNLDEQIDATFARAQLQPHQARSSAHLVDLIEDERVRVITTVIDKFMAAVDRESLRYEGENLYVLVDEAHRSQYGTKHIQMRLALPNACYIAFTGTPIVRRQKNILRKFGSFIHKYTLHEATEEDEIVLPLLYESRSPELSFSERPADRYFDRVMEGASEYQIETAQEWAARKPRFYESQQIVEEIAHHISNHYLENWRGTGLKAQLAAPLKDTALRYHAWFEEHTDLRTAVIISPPDEPEEGQSGWEDDGDRVHAFWDHVKSRYGTQEAYEKHVLESFKHDPQGIEIVIVVGKLLTGFDAPRNTVLYVAKPLSSHTLLQAIARVNRIFPGKDFGYIVDYYDILGNLDQALHEYEALAGYDEEDLRGTLMDVRQEIDKLPGHHSRLLDVFRQEGLPVPSCDPRTDPEPYEQLLHDEAIRDLFYERLSTFSRSLQLARSSLYFHETPRLRDQEEVYRCHLRFFQSLRRSVQTRYGERSDFKEYKGRIRTLMDRYLHVDDIEPLTEQPINIFDSESFLRQVEEMGGSPASKADTIAHQVRRVITLRMDEDRARYRSISERLKEAIDAFHEERLAAQEYLERVKSLYEELVHGRTSVPQPLVHRKSAVTYYSSVLDVLEEAALDNGESTIDIDRIAQAGVDIEDIIQEHKIVDWKKNPNVKANMSNAVEDYLLELADELGISLSFDDIDRILDDVIKTAYKRP